MASALRKQGELGDAHDYCSVSELKPTSSARVEMKGHKQCVFFFFFYSGGDQAGPSVR